MRTRTAHRAKRKATAAVCFGLWALSCATVCQAKPRLPKGDLKPPIVQDLPPPLNLQAKAVQKTAVISWSWVPPDPAPEFREFGFEIERNDGRRVVVELTEWTDREVQYGTWTYQVRARGLTREAGVKVSRISRWIGPIEIEIPVVCPRAPRVELHVEAPQRRYTGPPSLRLRLRGQVENPSECSSLRAFYSIDSGMGLAKQGPLTIKSDGRFDEWIDASEPGDEIPATALQFSITATAENNAGLHTSPPVRIMLQSENPYAPRDPF